MKPSTSPSTRRLGDEDANADAMDLLVPAEAPHQAASSPPQSSHSTNVGPRRGSLRQPGRRVSVSSAGHLRPGSEQQRGGGSSTGRRQSSAASPGSMSIHSVGRDDDDEEISPPLTARSASLAALNRPPGSAPAPPSRRGSVMGFAQSRTPNVRSPAAAPIAPSALPGHARRDSDSESDGENPDEAAEIEGQEDVPLCLRKKHHPSLNHEAFFCLNGDNPFRLLMLNVSTSKLFEAIIIAIIVANCVVLAIDDPTDKHDPEWSVNLNYFFIAAFTLEMLMKLVAFGFVGHPGAYLRSNWNRLDFIIVVFSYLTLLPGFGNYTALRAFRVLRPLRSMNAIPPLRQLVTVLLRSLAGLANVLLLIAFLFSIFGVFAVQLFMGTMRQRCRDDATGEVTEDHCNTGNTYGGWFGRSCPAGFSCYIADDNPNFGFTNYDNILWACLVIVQVLTMEDWASLMYMTMDAYTWFTCIYFVLLVILGAYLVLNLALAVISAEFEFAQEELEEQAARERAAAEHEELMAAGAAALQNNMFDTQRRDSLALDAEQVDSLAGSDSFAEGYNHNPDAGPPPPAQPTLADRFEAFRLTLFTHVEGDPDASEDERAQQMTPFGKFIILCILLNTVVMAADHHGASDTQVEVAFYSNIVFASIFTVEMLLKIVAFTPLGYVRDSTNVFDAFIVIVSWIEIGLGGNAQFSVLRTFRLLRVFKLFKSFPSLLAIVEVIGFAVRDSAYLNVLIFLYLFIASLFGMEFFGGQYPQEDADGEAIRSRFDSFYLSFLTVFQVLTRDDWPGLMHNAMHFTSVAAFLYFVCCVVAGDLVILNLFLSIVISSFDKVGKVRAAKQLILDQAKSPTRKRGAAVTLSDGLEGKIMRVQDLHAGGTAAHRREMNTLLGVSRPVDDLIFRADDELNGEVVKEIEMRQSTIVFSDDTASPKHGNKTNAPASSPQQQQRQSSQHGATTPDPNLPADRTTEHSDARSHLGTSSNGPHVLMSGESSARRQPSEGDHVSWGREPGEAVQNSSLGATDDPFIHFGAAEEGGVDFMAAVEMATDMEFNRQGTKVLSICGRCRDPIVAPFATASKDIAGFTAQELHDRVCDRIQVRKAKEVVIRQLVRQLRTRIARAKQRRGRERPTARDVEDTFGRAWEVGLLLGEDFDDHLSRPSWQGLIDALLEEREVLNLRVGEDQLGMSLVAYTRGNIPHETMTNGGVSLFIFGRHNPLRIALTKIVTHGSFDAFIMACILMSSLLLALDDPRQPKSERNRVQDLIGDVFTSIFIVECVMKVIAFGFVLHPTAYLRDPWNVLDFFIVLIGILSWALSGITDVGFLKVLRTFRALRPLRVINRNRGLKMVVLTLIESMKGIVNVALITILIWLVFAILGTQLFAGKLYYCSDGEVHERYRCVGQYAVANPDYDPSANASWPLGENGYNATLATVNATRDWLTHPYNFDNSYNSFLTLFVVATLDDWSTKMYYTIDLVDENHGPCQGNHPEYGIYFVAFIMIGSFFLLSFFVGVVAYNYSRTKDQIDGLSLLTPEQKHWVETQRMVLNFRPTRKNKRPQDSAVRAAVFDMVESTYFEIATGAVVMLNLVIIAMDHYDQSQGWQDLQRWSNIAFVVVFALEWLVKSFGLGPRQYFLDNWNRFDFFLVIAGFFTLLDVFELPINPNLLRVLRVFRIMRLLTLVKKAKRVRMLLETLWYSLPSLANIGLFLLLVFFIFAVLGVQLFANVRPSDDGELDSKWSNFATFGNSFLMLVRITTMDNWGVIMTATSTTSACGTQNTAYGEINTCGTPASPIYYFVFLVIAAFVLLNVFVAVILDNFNTTMKLDHSEVNVMDLKKFSDAWARFDDEAEMVCDTKHFPSLLCALKPPLGAERRGDRVVILQRSIPLKIPEHGGIIHFAETLIPLARAVQHVQFTEAELRDHEDHWKTQFPALNDLAVLRYRQKRVTVDQYLAASYIQAAQRRRRAGRIVDAMREEKINEIDRWYTASGVPFAERDAVHRLRLRNELRLRRRVAEDREAALRAAQLAAEATEDPQNDSHSASVRDDGASNSSMMPMYNNSSLFVHTPVVTSPSVPRDTTDDRHSGASESPGRLAIPQHNDDFAVADVTPKAVPETARGAPPPDAEDTPLHNPDDSRHHFDL